MNATDIQSLKEMLLGMLAEIEGKSAQGAATLFEGVESCADPNDRATQEADLNFTLLMQERDLTTARAIREALDRIDNGEYGYCDECGEDIAVARLRALPMTRMCVSCQSKLEAVA